MDYHMATPNLPEIKSYIDSDSAQKVLNQFKIFGQGGGGGLSADRAQPFNGYDNTMSFPAAFSANDDIQTIINTSAENKTSLFSWKTMLLCILFFVAFVFFYYYQYERIQWATNLAGYETQKIVDKINFESHLNSTKEYVRKITGRIMDVDETILSPM